MNLGKSILYEQLQALSAPIRICAVDFFRESDIHTTIALFKLHLGACLHEEGIVDPDTTLGALFDDSNDENWGHIEARWGGLFEKYIQEMQANLTRSAELFFDIETEDVTPEHEKEWDDLGEQYDTLVERLLAEIHEDIQQIIEGLRNMPQMKI